MKIERFVRPRFVVTIIRHIAKGDPRRQFAARACEIKLMRKHFTVGKRLVMIGAHDSRRTRDR
jgi:hypothetical protein